MWEPKTLEEFERAVASGAVDERHDFDAKRQLPENGKELAKDIAAMSTDGGCLVYGVGEDEDRRPRLLAPFPLAGAAERIDQVAQQSLYPSPKLHFIPLRRPDEPEVGYLIVVIPASPMAPHQVSVGDDRRFYGRCDTGNRRLTEAEIERFYERRQRQNVDREKLLAECIASSPIGQPEPGKNGFLQAFAQPAIRDDQLWDRAVSTRGDERQLLDSIREGLKSVPSVSWGGMAVGSILNWRPRGADKWSLNAESTTSDPTSLKPEDQVVADLGMDGRCYLFYGGAALSTDRNNARHPIFTLYEIGIALNLAEFFALVGAYYKAGEQWGPIDIGMAVTGIHGAISSHLVGDILAVPQPYGDSVAVRALRCDARDLVEDPLAASRQLLERLMRVMSGKDSFDPLADN